MTVIKKFIFSIPTLNYNTPNLVRLMQIAYNAGQLKAAYNDEIYTPELKQYYKENNLDNIETYMDLESLQLLNDEITKEMMASVKALHNVDMKGGYKKKYFKYKNKYLELKKN